MLRLIHFLNGHQWKVVSTAWVPPDSETKPYGFTETNPYGFTETIEHCACGARRYGTVYGNHSGLK